METTSSKWRWLVAFACIFGANLLIGQDNYFRVDQIHLTGNKKTKARVILRELDFKSGDTIFLSDIQRRFFENEKRILNTALFNDVLINIVNWDTKTKIADVDIQLQENWYIYPAPIFELADRNFNVWWNEQNRSLDRVNYGLRLSHINFTGNKDALKLVAQFGYTRKFEAEYDYPYLNAQKTLGLAGSVFYSENKEIGYVTVGNKTQFHEADDERILLRRFRLGLRMNYRPDLFHFHTVKFEFHRNSVAPLVSATLNPDYFLDRDTRLRFFLLEYDYQYDRRIFKLFPEGGYRLSANIKKEGLGLFNEFNNLSVTAIAEKYWKPWAPFIASVSIKGKTNLIRKKVAFANNTGLGYGDNIVSGFELYVVDGTDYALYKSSLKFRFLNKFVNYGKLMPLQQFRRMALRAYLTFNFDAAYVNEPTYRETNFLNNRWIYGFGPALEVVVFHNYLFQIEYSFNDLGEGGLFLHNSVSF